MINNEYPSAFLFCNGTAAYFDDQDQQMKEIPSNTWRGLHVFHRIYPDAHIHLQGCEKLTPEMIEHFLKNIKKPKIFTEIDDGDIVGASMTL